MSDRNGALPEGWAEATLGELGEWKGGGTPSKSNSKFWTNGTVPWISPKDMKRFYLDDAEDQITQDAVVNSSAQLFPADSVLVVTRSGILERILPVAINRVPVATNQDLKTLLPTDGIDARYVAYLLKGKDQHLRDECSKDGTTVASIDLPKLKAYGFGLAPEAEQRRIVSKIESLQERSSRARRALSEVGPLLEQFRQSVLRAAFSGRLTADWRAANPNVEPADWFETAIANAADTESTRSSKKRLWGSGSTIAEADPSWGEIPDSWQWVQIKELGFDPGSVVQIGPMSMKSKEFVDDGTTVLNVGCVQWGWIDLSKANYLPTKRANDFERYRVKPGDVMFTRSGTVGRSAVVPPNVPDALMTFHLLRVRTEPNLYLPELLYFAFQGCPAVSSQIEVSAMGATRAGFNTRLLEEMWVPLPPPSEQVEMIGALGQFREFESSVAESVAESESALTQLDQSILAKAFRGELVPQDPRDEPASELLARIRTTREAKPLKKKALWRKKTRGGTK